MTTKALYDAVTAYFQEHLPDARSELHFENAFQLLVAVMLSAQCTDKRVNLITPALFEALPTPERMASSSPEEILTYVSSCSYPNSKSMHLWQMACKLTEKFHGIVPQTVEDLMQLPGVGRKTANVMMAVMFGQPAMPVDTHVFRVSHRLGLVKDASTPEETERQLTSHLPRSCWSLAHHWLLLHGRYVCKARRPECEKCGLASVCQFCHEQKCAKLS